MPRNRHPGFLCHLATLADPEETYVAKLVASVDPASSIVLENILRGYSLLISPRSCLHTNNLSLELLTFESESFTWKGFCEEVVVKTWSFRL